MEFNLNTAIDLLSGSPKTLRGLLQDLPNELENSREGENTWSPKEIIRHLTHCEQEDWIPRMKVILDSNGEGKFPPFDRFGHLDLNLDKSMDQLLVEFGELRKNNINILISSNLDEETLNKTGIHPEFGSVSLKQLLAAWITHDLSHISQICRVIAKQFKEDAGPWKKYMRIINT